MLKYQKILKELNKIKLDNSYLQRDIFKMKDTLEKIEKFLSEIDTVVQEGLATMEKVNIRFYRARAK